MDYREERFDHFGFESPFASGEGEASGVGVEAEVMFAPDTGFFERPWEQEREAQGDVLKLAEMLAIPGRFDDPKRNPATEKDGTRFDVFLKDGDRAAFVQKWLAACPQLAQAAAEPHGDLKTSDIAKGWFVIHDVGVKSSLSDTRFKAKDTKKKSVHGFVNRAGNYAATHDFAKRKSGTIYEFVSKRGKAIAGGKTVNIETVPDIEDVRIKADGTLPAPRNAERYASIGFRRNKPAQGQARYYKWTKEAFDVIAGLYILASARAGHLLTLTAHKEMDRNLGRAVIWEEYNAAALANPKGSLKKYLVAARDRPSDYHGDPYGFDFQALYDVITRKLNALGGTQMPVGARYGINPLRVRKADGEDIGNGDGQKHEFPLQSDPVIKRATGLKKKGWWNSAKSSEAAFEDEFESYEFEGTEQEALDPGHAFEDEESWENPDFESDEQSWSAGDEEESLAWLDLEEEDFENYLFEDEWEDEGEEKASPSRPAPTPLLGGQLWSGSDAKLGMKHAIFVSPAALGQARVELLFYVHGLLRPCGGLPGGGVAAFVSDDTFALGASVVASGRPIILIVPQFQEANDRKWSSLGLEKPAALNSYLERCQAEVGSVLGCAAPEVSGLIIAGHSRAYGVLNPLAAAYASPAMSQGPLASLSGMWFLDSSYGGFPSANAAALLKAKPALSVRQVYIAGSRTDVLGGRSRQGRLAYMPVSARKARHCTIPAKCLPDLLANRPLSIAPNPPARREAFADEQDFGSDGEDYASFALDDEEAGWSEAEGKDFDGADEDYSFGAGEDLADISAQDEFENFLDEGGTGTAGIQRDYSLKDLASGKLGAIPENLRDDILAGRQRDANAVANRIVAIKHPSLANQRLDPANRNHAKAIRDWSRASRDANALIWLTRIVAILDAHRGTLPRAFLLGWMAKESDGSVKPVTHLQERGYFQVHPAEAKDHLKLEGAAFEALTRDRNASIREGIRLVQVHRSHLAKSYGIADPSELLLQLTKARHGLPGALKKAISTIRATGMPLSWIWVAAFMSASKIGRRVVQNVDDTLDYAAELKQLSDKIPARTVANPEAFDESGTNWEDEVQSEWLDETASEWLDEYEFEEEEEGGEFRKLRRSAWLGKRRLWLDSPWPRTVAASVRQSDPFCTASPGGQFLASKNQPRIQKACFVRL